MYVKDHMTKNPYTITKDTVISKALEIMQAHDFHRLPVVDASGRLIGLVTGGLVKEKSGAESTSLSIFELNYLLSRTTVDEIMIRDVQTTKPDVFLEEAAQTMIDHSIAVLPVVDNDKKVIGIITEKDIFQAFNDIMGYQKQGSRFVINCPDKPGVLIGIGQLFAENNANVESIAVYRSEERGTEIVVKATGEIETDEMIRILLDAGYHVTNVVQTTYERSTRNYTIPS